MNPPPPTPLPRESLVDVVGLLLRRRRLIAAVTGGVALLSVVVAFALPVYYRATTTFYAASPDQTNPTAIFAENQTVDDFGDGDDLERLIGVASSQATLKFLIDSFGLSAVYEIDTDLPDAYYRTRRELEGLYEVTRTRYDAIEIAVEDKDPSRAARMATAARERTAAVTRQLLAQGRGNLEAVYRGAVVSKEAQRARVSDTLRVLNARFGIVDVETQAEALSGQLGALDRALARDSAMLAHFRGARGRRGRADSLAAVEGRLAGARRARARVLRQLDEFAEGSGVVLAYQTEAEAIAEDLADDREALRRVENANRLGGAVLYLLDEATVPQRKARPVRWLVVAGSTLAALLFTCLGVVVADTYKDVEWRRFLRA